MGFFSIDPALIEVPDILRRYFYAQLTDTVNMLAEVGQAEGGTEGKAVAEVL